MMTRGLGHLLAPAPAGQAEKHRGGSGRADAHPVCVAGILQGTRRLGQQLQP